MRSIFPVDRNEGTFIPQKDGKIFADLRDLPENANYPEGGQMNKFMIPS